MESRRDYIATELPGIEVQVRDSQRVRLMVGEFLHIKAGVDPRRPRGATPRWPARLRTW